MVFRNTISKVAVAILVIGGAGAVGVTYSDGDLPFSDVSESPTPTGGSSTPSGESSTPSDETNEPVVSGGEATPTPSPTPLTDIDDPSDSSFNRDALETTIHSEINDYLEGNDEDRLSWEPLGRDAARRHAQAMADAQEVSLEVGGATASERINEDMTCDPGVTLARVDSVTSGTAGTIVTEWAGTERTRATMTDNLNRRVSVGAAQGADGRVYVVAMFC